MNETLYEKLVMVGAAVLIAVLLWAVLILLFLLEVSK